MKKYYPRLPPSLGRDEGSSKQSHVEINLKDLPADPGLRTRILDYNPNVRDEFVEHIYKKVLANLETMIFLIRDLGKSHDDSIRAGLENTLDVGEQLGGDSFVSQGFSNWKKKDRLDIHVGGPNSAHNQSRSMCQALMNQKQHIQSIFSKQSDKMRIEYQTRLTASIDCIRFLLRQGLAFRGDDESEDSSNQGNFLETLRFLADHNEDINAVTLKNAPENLKLTAPDIQKDIVNVVAMETLNVIIRDIGDSFFSILIDESRDVSTKEQMACVLRYVDKNVHVVERFVGIVHVTDTTAISLKMAIDDLFSRHGLSISRLRGQGYDGASNMRGEFNGLKTLILKENECAFYIHCFAHQLQLALVGVAKKHVDMVSLFTFVANVVNVVGGSCKRRDILREKQTSIVSEELNSGDLSSGRGLNQNCSLKRSSDTRWGSHYDTLISLITMFSSVVSVIETIANDRSSEQKFEVNILLEFIGSFNFIFSLHLMRTLLGITNELSKALQRKDQDIVNAMSLVKACKQQLQTMRENGWDSLLDEVSSFCVKYEILVPNMEDMFLVRGRPRRNVQENSNLHHYRVELFYAVLDMQLQELNGRFTEANTELLLCVACLCPDDSFFAFEKQKLLRLAQFYPKEFSPNNLMKLNDQLETYIVDVRSSSEFEGLKGIGDLAKTMVETKRDKVHSLVYLLVTLALILPVATATVERAFSAMNIVKNRLRNKMGDQWMSDSLTVYIEKEIFDSIDNEAIIRRFQNMKSRRGQL